MIALCALVALAYALAAIEGQRLRPMAVALAGQVAVDTVRLATMSTRLDAALYLAHPALSAWAVIVTLRPGRRAGAVAASLWLAAALVVAEAPRPALWWDWLPAIAWGAATVASVAAVASWAYRGPSGGRAELAAVVAATGDAAALAVALAGGRPAALARIAAAITWGALAAVLLLPIPQKPDPPRSAGRA